MNQTDKILALTGLTLKKKNQVTSNATLRKQQERVRECYFGESDEGIVSEELTQELRFE